MNFAILICTRREPDVLARLTEDLYRREIFPALLGSEALGCGSVRIRLQIECPPTAMETLKAYWQSGLKLQTMIVTPLELGEPLPAPADPMQATKPGAGIS